MISLAKTLAALSSPYRVLFVDVWGVVHNGVAPFASACNALIAARRGGKQVILISNAPRLASEIPPQFKRIGVPEGVYDAIVTSGDATREIIAQWSKAGRIKLHHIGPDRDLSVFEGLDIERVALGDASHAVCTGLWDDETESPADYEEVLAEIARHRLPFLCANPDIVVQRGDRLLYCAGALARRLEEMGGAVIYPGKPYAPIYELAMARAGAPAKREVLAIGDGLATDILGAQRFGIASLLIVSGIHAGEFQSGGKIDLGAIQEACDELGVAPIAAMTELGP
ncbi:MAG: TIGR01459 family HAD-type hydrolase [Alphaproteobacteria bacterium]